MTDTVVRYRRYFWTGMLFPGIIHGFPGIIHGFGMGFNGVGNRPCTGTDIPPSSFNKIQFEREILLHVSAIAKSITCAACIAVTDILMQIFYELIQPRHAGSLHRNQAPNVWSWRTQSLLLRWSIGNIHAISINIMQREHPTRGAFGITDRDATILNENSHCPQQNHHRLPIHVNIARCADVCEALVTGLLVDTSGIMIQFHGSSIGSTNQRTWHMTMLLGRTFLIQNILNLPRGAPYPLSSLLISACKRSR